MSTPRELRQMILACADAWYRYAHAMTPSTSGMSPAAHARAMGAAWQHADATLKELLRAVGADDETLAERAKERIA